jgi:hypothetical protein
MIYGRVLISITMLAALLLLGSSSAADWLEGGNVGPIDRNQILPYFSDPIFYTNPTVSYRQSHPYYAREYFNISRPNVIRLGKYPHIESWGTYPWGTYPWGTYPSRDEVLNSEFRLSSLAAMQWTPFQKNWTETMSYAKSNSSLRVHQGGGWKAASQLDSLVG